ncbi:beta-lactamase family protein [Grosmannia clavigera kw1407]|uniref:Beta-lactamase family protein n=1 Tax=Grosmannia clavigera (strain kw1407 / UAMH 11150) TaxID=655863 RepID=F0XJB5_GROCL|nr:beta-lactamase family protein [Grosmannia clavigera kw1407]EFX02237.1 beta-lactamase family protein [Grosmannia clavigera kw1407]
MKLGTVQTVFSLIFSTPGATAYGVRSDELSYGTPESVGMSSQALAKMVSNLTAFTHAANYSKFSKYEVHPIQPGGAILVGRHGKIVSEFAFGNKSLYADGNGTILPSYEQEEATVDTIYDMASLTKLFTTIIALQQMDAGKMRLTDNVTTFIPGFGVNGKDNITIEMLLTHTSGFAPDPSPSLYSDSYSAYDERIDAIITQSLENAPGSIFLYSDLNFMTMMLVVQNITGKKLDQLVAEGITAPLGMASTFFNRNNVEGHKNPHYRRTAPTEFQIEILGSGEPDRPQPVRGSVHDENAWALEGVSGHAGLFSTVKDTARFCQMILNNGTYGYKRILSQQAVDLIFTNLNARFQDINSDHGAGFELDQFYTAGPLYTLLTASHTGYTGTSVVIDRGRDLFYLHFANRVHPTRNWSSNNIIRETLGYWVGNSLGLNLTLPAY